jgi:hypothetical protein
VPPMSNDGGQVPGARYGFVDTEPGSSTSQTSSIERTGISGATAPQSVGLAGCHSAPRRGTVARDGITDRSDDVRRVTRPVHGRGVAFEAEPKTFGRSELYRFRPDSDMAAGLDSERFRTSPRTWGVLRRQPEMR